MVLVIAGALLYTTVDAFYHQPFNPLVAEGSEWEPSLKPILPEGDAPSLFEWKRPYTFGEKRRSPPYLGTEQNPARAQAAARLQSRAVSRSEPPGAATSPGVAPPADVANKEKAAAGSAAAIGSPTTAAAEGRVTILLMGIDRRPGEPFISRTDTMMLLSFDAGAGTASILSLPRDLYVPIAGHGQNRINSAFVYGAAGNNPAAGAELAMQTVSELLDVPIDHYLLVDFSAFIRTIDLLGGIEVYLPEPIDDSRYPDMNYGYEPLYIPAGRHHFDGETALKYARTRGQDNDFYRAQRQQQVVLAVRRKALQLGLPGLIGRAPALYRQVSQGVFTDLTLDEMLRLAQLTASLESDAIETAVLDFNYVSSHRTENGAQVLLLSQTKAAPLISRLFHDTQPAPVLHQAPPNGPPLR
jgi:polyisoprenyl-teichoic acid--peptidoglycan teichoic acid transferase